MRAYVNASAARDASFIVGEPWRFRVNGSRRAFLRTLTTTVAQSPLASRVKRYAAIILVWSVALYLQCVHSFGAQCFHALTREIFQFAYVGSIGPLCGYIWKNGVSRDECSCPEHSESILGNNIRNFKQRIIIVPVSIDGQCDSFALVSFKSFQDIGHDRGNSTSIYWRCYDYHIFGIKFRKPDAYVICNVNGYAFGQADSLTHGFGIFLGCAGSAEVDKV